MHDTAYGIGAMFLDTYARAAGGLVVDVGAYDVNGSLRPALPPGCIYLGLDLAAGPNVDVVVGSGGRLPLAYGCAGAVLASSTFEHDPAFWITFAEMCRAARPGGFIYVSAPSNGIVHRFPVDCWRFYPDAAHALVRHASREGYPVALVESFTAERVSDHWNDFVAVFQRLPGAAPDVRMYLRLACRNAYHKDEPALIFEESASEDQRLLVAAEAGSAPRSSQVEAMVCQAYEALLDRQPSDQERAIGGALALQDGLTPLLRRLVAEREAANVCSAGGTNPRPAPP